MTARFSTVLADPPWRTHSGRLTGRKGFVDSYSGPVRALPYATMRVEDIARLPVADVAEPNSHLWLWAINGYLEAAFDVMRAWGFRFSTAHVWAKAAMGGGLGESFGITTEFLLFGRRGRCPMMRRTTGTWHRWKRPYVDGKPTHSKKPMQAYELIEQVSPGPYLEMFSRAKQPRLGWSYWGDESLGTATLGAIA